MGRTSEYDRIQIWRCTIRTARCERKHCQNRTQDVERFFSVLSDSIEIRFVPKGSLRVDQTQSFPKSSFSPKPNNNRLRLMFFGYLKADLNVLKIFNIICSIKCSNMLNNMPYITRLNKIKIYTKISNIMYYIFKKFQINKTILHLNIKIKMYK